MIIAVDFDGTLVTNDYPNICKPKGHNIAFVKKMKSKGNKLILWTCREGRELTEAVTYLENLGLTFDAINDNLDENKSKYQNNSRKVYADLYIDDKAINGV